MLLTLETLVRIIPGGCNRAGRETKRKDEARGFFFALSLFFSLLCWVYMSSAQKALSFFIFIPLIRILNMLMYSCIFFFLPSCPRRKLT